MKKQIRAGRLITAVFLCVTMVIAPMSVAAENTVPDMLADNNLPVVNITIDEDAEGFGTIEEMNTSPDHSVKCTGSVKITVPEGYTGDYSVTALSDTKDLALEYIRGRGNTTWGQEKKPYKLKLDKKADLLGMGKNKHWVLLANDMDPTLLRNRIVSYIGNALGLAYTPKMLPVDVVMNGKYLGNYYLAEQVRVGETRVNIDELTPDDDDEPEITGGYLLGYHPDGNEPEENRFYTEKGVGFLFENPEFYSDDPTDELGTAAQKVYISDYLQKTEDAIYSGNAEDYMDLQSAADYWWVQTYSYNYDAFFTPSTYLYKPRNDKLYWGPLWDFDLSFGKSMFSGTEGYGIRPIPWFDYLRENDADFRQLLLQRWAVLDPIITDIVKDGGVLDGYMAEIKNSWEDNLPLSEDSYADFETETESLREWMTQRQEWINENLDAVGKVYCTVTFTADDKVVEESVKYAGYPLEKLPAAPEKEGYIFLGWEYEGEILDESNLPYIRNDAVITAKYLNEEEAVHADTLYFDSYDVWADINDDVYYTYYTVTPEDAQEKSITWSVSDTSVGEIDDKGDVTLKQPGEITVTGTLKSGFSRSYTLHIYDGNTTALNEPESVALEQTVIKLKVGEYAQIIASVSPQPCESDLTYMCDDNEEIISVLDCGVIKALAPGTTTVRVWLKDNIAADCTVIVTDGEEPSDTAAQTTEPQTSSAAVAPAAGNDAKSSTTDSAAAPAGNRAVQTGDSLLIGFVLMILIAAAGIVTCYIADRKQHR